MESQSTLFKKFIGDSHTNRNKKANWLHAELFFCAGFHVLSQTPHDFHVETMWCSVKTM